MIRTTIIVIVTMAFLTLACSGKDEPGSPPVADPTVEATPTPSPVEDEISETVLQIMHVRTTAAYLEAWAAALLAGQEPIKTLPEICEGVNALGVTGLQLDSIWPQAYKAIDRELGISCKLAHDNRMFEGDTTGQLAYASIVAENLLPLTKAVDGDESFDIENKVRERAEARERAR